MLTITREVDQWIQIGQDIFVAPTDIDERGARLIARGRVLGGEEDGATFRRAAELSLGGELRLGPSVVITIVGLARDAVRLAVIAPKHIGIHRKELVDQVKRARDD